MKAKEIEFSQENEKRLLSDNNHLEFKLVTKHTMTVFNGSIYKLNYNFSYYIWYSPITIYDEED